MRLLRALVTAAALLWVVAVPAYVAAPAGAATAGACAPGGGVTVVVDFHELGGGAQETCDPAGGGRSAETIFPEAGVSLAYAQRVSGAVCKVDGKPADQSCQGMPPANAYWSLWWAGPASTSWTYASEGVSGLTIPDGGYVAFSWQGSSTQAPPGVAPAHGAATPKPTKTAVSTPTRTASAKPKKHPTTAAGPTRSDTPSAHASVSPSVPPSSPGASPTESASAPASPRSEPANPRTPATTPVAQTSADPCTTASPCVAGGVDDGSSHGAPGWIAPAIVGALVLVAGAIILARRRTG